VPVFLQPYFLFFLAWFLSLTFLSMSVTKVSFDDYSEVILVILVSCVSFLFGYLFSRILSSISDRCPAWCGFNLKINRFDSSPEVIYLALVFACLVLVFYNFYVDGYPPFFGFFGFKTDHYNEYGRFIGLLVPLLSSAAIAAVYLNRRYSKLIGLLFVYLIFMVYVLRGPMIISFFQVFVIFLITNYQGSRDKIKYYARYLVVSIFVLIFVLVVFSVVGTHRSGLESFYEFLRIEEAAKQEYSTLTLWVATYFSIPVSNFFWFYSEVGFSEVDFSFLSRLLPAFWVVESEGVLHDIESLDSYMIDDVHFYLFYWYSGLGMAGVVFLNFIYGFLGHFLSKNTVLYSVIASVIMFSFFIDYLFYFSVVVQIFILIFISKYLQKKL